ASKRTRFTFTRMTGGCARAAAAIKKLALNALSRHRRALIPFSFHPDLPILEVLLFPDRDQALDAVDALERRLECGPAMGGRDDDRNARLADEHAAQTVHHGEAIDRVDGGDFAADLRDRLDGHRLVTFVIEKPGTAPLCIVADNAFERDHGA